MVGTVTTRAGRSATVVFGKETIGDEVGRASDDHMTSTPPVGRVFSGRPQTVRDPVVVQGSLSFEVLMLTIGMLKGMKGAL